MTNYNLDNLKNLFEEKFNCNCGFEIIDNNSEPITFGFENSFFQMSFWFKENIFIIGNLEVLNKGEGTGNLIIEILKQYCDDENIIEIIANKVKSEAVGFWEKMSFIENNEGDFYLEL